MTTEDNVTIEIGESYLARERALRLDALASALNAMKQVGAAMTRIHRDDPDLSEIWRELETAIHLRKDGTGERDSHSQQRVNDLAFAALGYLEFHRKRVKERRVIRFHLWSSLEKGEAMWSWAARSAEIKASLKPTLAYLHVRRHMGIVSPAVAAALGEHSDTVADVIEVWRRVGKDDDSKWRHFHDLCLALDLLDNPKMKVASLKRDILKLRDMLKKGRPFYQSAG